MNRVCSRKVTLKCQNANLDLYFDNAEDAFEWMQKTDSAASEGPNPQFSLSITDDTEVSE